MAFADWTVVNSNTAIARDTGVAHTLAGAGTRLRRAEGVVPPSSPSSFTWGSLCRTSLLDPGDSGTIAVSQRVWVRYTQAFRGSSDLGDGLCIAAKGYYNGGSLQIHPGGEGYKAIFGMHDGTGNPAESATFGLRLHRSGSSEAVAAVESASFTPVQGTWYAIRLDCVPLSATKDVLRVYSGTGTVGDETWTLQIEVFPESGTGTGWCSNSALSQLQAYGLGWQQYGEVDTNAQMDFHHYRALIRTGGPFPDEGTPLL